MHQCLGVPICNMPNPCCYHTTYWHTAGLYCVTFNALLTVIAGQQSARMVLEHLQVRREALSPCQLPTTSGSITPYGTLSTAPHRVMFLQNSLGSLRGLERVCQEVLKKSFFGRPRKSLSVNRTMPTPPLSISSSEKRNRKQQH